MRTFDDSFILDLISLRQEGGYWDFKREWHSNNADLLHDIICMANNLENRDGYIIIGVDEENNYELCDVSQDRNRKTTENIVTFLRDKSFAGGIRPTVNIETVNIGNACFDVVVIRSDRFTPYYLSCAYQSVFANNIYTRVQDTNTPKNRSADIHHIELLWKKRFGLDKSALERLDIVLDDFSNWVYKSGQPHYHKLFPEFHIEYDKDYENDNDLSHERYAGFYINTKASWYGYKIYYHSTILHDSVFLYLDETRIMVSDPTTKSFRSDAQEFWYYYYEKDSINGKMLRLFTESEHYDTTSRFLGGGAFLVFDNKDSREEFEAFVLSHEDIYDSIELDAHAERAIAHEKKQQWQIECCESMARLYQMYLRWEKEVTL